MNIQKQAIQEYLVKGYMYRQLAEKYSVSRCTINRWVLVHQAIHDLPRSKRQHSYDLQQMSQAGKSKQKQVAFIDVEQRIAFLEKQLQWKKMRADALEQMIEIAEKELHIPIRKKPGAEPLSK